ncbi:MAG TPA: MFS transporter [Stellaceae bacterium]|jgi:predicted MFS family arabinose efflux permease|nr:MFS transporter [Stellaceae bacterium]
MTAVAGEPKITAEAVPYPPLLLLGFTCFASNISMRAVDPMVPVIASRFAVTLHEAAWLITAFGLLYALSQPVLGPLADALGKSAVIKTCVALLAACFAACALAPSFTALLIARGISGAVAGGIVPVAFALVGDRVPYEKRQIAISRLVIAVITGQMSGALLAGILAQYAGWRAVFIAMAILAAGVAAAALWRLDGRADLRRPFSFTGAANDYAFLMKSRRARIVYGATLLEGLFVFGVFPFVAATLLARGQGGTLTAGLCIASYALGGMIYGLSARHIIARLGPWRMMAGGGVLIGICYGIIAMPVPWPAMAALFAFSGFGFYLLHNNLQTLSTELAPQARGAAVATLAAAYFIGQGASPILSGQISSAGGYGAMFAASGILTAVLGVTSSRLLKRDHAA